MVGAEENGVQFLKPLLIPRKFHQTQNIPKAGFMIGEDTKVVDLRTRELVVSPEGKDKRT